MRKYFRRMLTLILVNIMQHIICWKVKLLLLLKAFRCKFITKQTPLNLYTNVDGRIPILLHIIPMAFILGRLEYRFTSKNLLFYKLRESISGFFITLKKYAFYFFSIMKMQEAGLIDKWKQKWWPSSDKCSGSERTSSATILGLDSLAGPFLIYASVVGVALLCLILELGLHVTKLNMLCQKIKQCQSSGTQDLSLHRSDSRT